MNFREFEELLKELVAKEDYDSADKISEDLIPVVVAMHGAESDEQKKFLKFYSEAAGDAESYDRLNRLLSLLLERRLISESEAEQLLGDAPANRWL